MKPIALQAVEAFSRFPCPCCGGSLDGFEWVDGDTVDAFEPGDPYAAHLMWGACPDCREELYSLELTVVSEGRAGAYLFNDHCWKAQGQGLYTATRGKQSWELVHYWHVADISFLEETDHQHHARPWLDIHSFEPLPARDKPAAFALAAKIARSLAPDLARLNW